MATVFELIIIYLLSVITIYIILSILTEDEFDWVDYAVIFCPVFNSLVLVSFLLLCIIASIETLIKKICTRLRL